MASIFAEASAAADAAQAAAGAAVGATGRIKDFTGDFAFLGLDHACEVWLAGVLHKSARHAVLAAQFPSAAGGVALAPSPVEARNATAGHAEGIDWAACRLRIMERIQRDKFRRSEELRRLLKETGSREIAWRNSEGESFWGLVPGPQGQGLEGQNQLGKILMDIRKAIQDGQELEKWLQVNCELETDPFRRPPMQLVEEKMEGSSIARRKAHQLSGSASFKLGRSSSCTVVASNDSIADEHAVLLHTRSKAAQLAGGLALVDLGSGSGVWIGDRKLLHPWAMEPVGHGMSIRLGDSSRTYTIKASFMNAFLGNHADDDEAEPRAARATAPAAPSEGIRILQDHPAAAASQQVDASAAPGKAVSKGKGKGPGSPSPDRARRRPASRSRSGRSMKGSRQLHAEKRSKARQRKSRKRSASSSSSSGSAARKRAKKGDSPRRRAPSAKPKKRSPSNGKRGSHSGSSSASSASKAKRKKSAPKKPKRKK